VGPGGGGGGVGVQNSPNTWGKTPGKKVTSGATFEGIGIRREKCAKGGWGPRGWAGRMWFEGRWGGREREGGRREWGGGVVYG